MAAAACLAVPDNLLKDINSRKVKDVDKYEETASDWRVIILEMVVHNLTFSEFSKVRLHLVVVLINNIYLRLW